MKKIVLLLTILCVGALNGMEPEQHSRWNYLPTEIKNQIIEYDGYFRFLPDDIKVNIVSLLGATTSNNLNDVIKDLKLKSSINKQWYATVNDQKAFTALAHTLAEKFNTSTFNVAQKFNTDASQKYLALGAALVNAIIEKNNDKVAELINQGVDVNFMQNPWLLLPGGRGEMAKYRGNTPLIIAILYKSPAEIVKLLLDAGANSDLEAHVFEPLFNVFKKTDYSEEVVKIRILFEEARKKRETL